MTSIPQTVAERRGCLHAHEEVVRSMTDHDALEARLRAVEDRLAVYDLVATQPLAGDTGDPALIEAIYAEDVTVDRGRGLDGARGRDAMTALLGRAEHDAAIAGGLAHFGNLPVVDVDGDTATAVSYIALITPDTEGEPHELPNHGISSGYRVHRVVVNRWSFRRDEDGWRITGRTVLPVDGQGPALELLREAGRHHLRGSR